MTNTLSASIVDESKRDTVNVINIFSLTVYNVPVFWSNIIYVFYTQQGIIIDGLYEGREHDDLDDYFLEMLDQIETQHELENKIVHTRDALIDELCAYIVNTTDAVELE